MNQFKIIPDQRAKIFYSYQNTNGKGCNTVHNVSAQVGFVNRKPDAYLFIKLN